MDRGLEVRHVFAGFGGVGQGSGGDAISRVVFAGDWVFAMRVAEADGEEEGFAEGIGKERLGGLADVLGSILVEIDRDSLFVA